MPDVLTRLIMGISLIADGEVSVIQVRDFFLVAGTMLLLSVTGWTPQSKFPCLLAVYDKHQEILLVLIGQLG